MLQGQGRAVAVAGGREAGARAGAEAQLLPPSAPEMATLLRHNQLDLQLYTHLRQVRQVTLAHCMHCIPPGEMTHCLTHDSLSWMMAAEPHITHLPDYCACVHPAS